MNDRELLELAAKASGYIHRWLEDGDNPKLRVCYSSTAEEGQLFDSMDWNPLTDDGDALRLAVKLKMNVCLAGLPHVYADMPGCDFVTDVCSRRAIVRAAAAIGQAMK